MYGPKWPFVLMYGSHEMRHTGIPRVDGLSTDPRDLRRHIYCRDIKFLYHERDYAFNSSLCRIINFFISTPLVLPFSSLPR